MKGGFVTTLYLSPGHADEEGEDSDDEEDERAGGPLHNEEGEEEDEGEGEGEEMDEEGFEGPNQMLDEVGKSIVYLHCTVRGKKSLHVVATPCTCDSWKYAEMTEYSCGCEVLLSPVCCIE